MRFLQRSIHRITIRDFFGDRLIESPLSSSMILLLIIESSSSFATSIIRNSLSLTIIKSPSSIVTQISETLKQVQLSELDIKHLSIFQSRTS
ncbi:hypothetical protein CsSME_00025786 [Camellia sinensis var. sinensis]